MQDNRGPTGPESARCPCDWLDENRRHERAEEVHGEILGFESRGLAGVTDFLDYVDMSADRVENPPLFPWDIEAFVAQHNWDSPARVARLAARVAGEHELRRAHTDGETVAQEDRMLTEAERAEFYRREHMLMLDEAQQAIERAVVMLAEALAEEPEDSDRLEALRGLLRSRDQLRCIVVVRFGEDLS